MFMETIDLGQTKRVGDHKSSDTLTKITETYEKEHKRMKESERIDKTIELYHKNIISLLDAVQCAGGDVAIVSKDRSLGEFLNTCAKNGIKISARHEPFTDEDVV